MDNRAIPDEIKGKLPIEELVGTYVPLKKAGRIYKGLCPFHNEKTPSFTVNPDRGIYKCFGCSEGGDIFSFVMKLEGLTFPEAVRMLGERVGVEVPEWKGEAEPKGPKKSRLYSLNDYLSGFWHKVLMTHPSGKDALDYLVMRGVHTESMKLFQIGYAPFGRVNQEALTRKQFDREEAEAAGRPERFQDRITFPIADITGKVVGFTGRLLEHPNDPKTTDRGPKYWNTPETALFIKSRTLYALHLAKHAMQDKQLVILAEGQMDVVMLHQAGYTHTVASSGTALTPEQLQLIRRFVPTIVFAYDGDKAGKEATKRGLELALAADLTAYVVVIPSGKDPADCVKDKPELWKESYENRLYYMDWILGQVIPEGVDTLPPEGRRQAAKELVGWLARMTDLTEQAEWFSKIAAHLQTNEDNLRELYRRLFPTKTESSARKTERTVTKPGSQPVIPLGETVAAIALTFPETIALFKEQLRILTPKDSFLVSTVLNLIDDEQPAASLAKLGDKMMEIDLAAEEVLQPYNGVEMDSTWAARELTLLLHRLRDRGRESEKARIATEIARAQSLGQTDKIKELIQELQTLV